MKKSVHFDLRLEKTSTDEQHLLYWYELYVHFSRIDNYFIVNQSWQADKERCGRMLTPIIVLIVLIMMIMTTM